MTKRLAAAFLLLLTASLHAADFEKSVPTAGGLCVLESSEPVTWIVAHPEIPIYATKDGLACFVDTSDNRDRIVLAVHGAPAGQAPVVDRWTVSIGGQPVPPGPDPEPEPEPPAPEPDTLAGWVSAKAKELVPAAEQANLTKVADAYDQIASQCGVTLFTGPAIRLATSNKILMDVPTVRAWEAFFSSLDTLNGEWMRQEFRDSAAYRDRWTQIASGLRGAVRGVQTPTPPGPRVTVLVAGTHQIRAGVLLERVCPPNGQCYWRQVGRIDKVEWKDGEQIATLKDE